MNFDEALAKRRAAREAAAGVQAQQPTVVQAAPEQAPVATPPAAPAAQPEAAPGGVGSAVGAVAQDVGMGLTEAPQAVARGGMEAISQLANTFSSAGNWLNEKVPLNMPVPKTRFDSVNRFVENPLKAISDAAGLVRDTLPETTTVTGKLTEDVSQFLAGFGVIGRIIKGGAWAVTKLPGVTAATVAPVVAPTTLGGRVGLEVTKEALTGAAAFDPHEERLSNLIQQYPSIANPVTAFLASDKEDGEAFGRLKSALENGGLAFAAERLAIAARSIWHKRNGDVEAAAADAKAVSELEDKIGVEEAPGSTDGVRITVERETAQTIDTTKTVNKDWTTESTTTRVTDRGVEPKTPIGPNDVVVQPVEVQPRLSPKSMDKVGEFYQKNGLKMGDEVPNELLDDIYQNIENRPQELQATYAAVAETFKSIFARTRGAALSEDAWRERAGAIAGRFAEMTNGDVRLIVQRMGADLAGMQDAAINMAAWMATHEMALRRLDRVSDMFFKNDAAAFGGDMGKLTENVLAELAVTLKLGALDEALGTAAARTMRARQVGVDTSTFDLGPLVRPDGEAQVMGELSQGSGVDRTTTTTQRVTENSKATTTEREGVRVSTRRSFVDIPRDLFEKIASGKASDIDSDALRTLLARVNLARTPKAKQAVLEDAAGPGLMDVHNEYWINALLSGPKTHVVNMVGGLLNATAIQPAERMIAGALSLNPALAREGVDQYVGMVKQLRETLGLTWQALKNGDAILDANKTVDLVPTHTISAVNFGLNPDTTAAGLVNALGTLIRLPSRLLTAEDELLKQLNYRGRVYALAARDAREKGLEGEAFSNHVASFMGASFDPATGKAVNEAALDYAQRATWTNDMVEGGVGETVQNMANKHPALRVILPFVRTPVNLFKDAVFHTPIVNMAMKEFREELSAGGQRSAMAAAKIATGGAMWGTAISLAQEGVITGSGPSDPKLRRQLEEGWQPNSVRVVEADGTVKFIQFSRLDPFAQFFQMAATFNDISGEMQDKDAEEFAVAGISAVAKMLQDKTFLSGIVNAINIFANPETRGEAGLQRHFASYIPAVQNNFKGDDWLRAPQSVLDAMAARTPGYGKVDPRFNALGEPVLAPGGWGPDWLSPFATREVKPDAVRDELARLAKLHKSAFGTPDKVVAYGRGGAGVDLTEYQTSDGLTAYGRYQQLVGEVKVNGRTLREELGQLISSPIYQRLTDGSVDFDGTKVTAVKALFGRYRAFALDALKKELPELKAEFDRLQQEQINTYRPQPTLLPQQ